MQFVFRQLEFADGREIFDWDVGKLQVSPGSHDDEFFSRGGSSCGHFADRRRDAVHVFQRVREPGAFAILQRNRDFAGQLPENGSQPFSRRRLTMKAVDVRCQNNEDRRDSAESLHAFNHVTATDLLNEFVEEPKRQLLSDHVRHEKCAPLRFAHLVQLRGKFCLHLRPREITGKLFP